MDSFCVCVLVEVKIVLFMLCNPVISTGVIGSVFFVEYINPPVIAVVGNKCMIDEVELTWTEQKLLMVMFPV